MACQKETDMASDDDADIQSHFSPPDDDTETADMAPAPASTIGSIPRFRREFLGHRAELRSTLEALLVYQKAAASYEVTRDVAVALACAASDTSYPPLDREEDRAFKIALSAATDGRCKGYAVLAIEIVENALRICVAALASLAMLDALDENITGDWHNLHPSIAGRRLIRLGHSLSRGSIPGWREAGE